MNSSLEDRYQDRYPRLCQGADVAERLMTALIDSESLNYLSITGRAKSPESFCTKARKTDADGQARYPDPLDQITDQIAVRVITFIPDDVHRACNIVHDQLRVEEDTDKGAQTAERGSFGYASRHFLVRLQPEREKLPENACLRGQVFEIQVRTVVQHAWAEFEHDIRYKRTGGISPDLKARFDRSFLLAAALLEKTDEEFSKIDGLVRQIDQESCAEIAVPVDQMADDAEAREEQVPPAQRDRTHERGSGQLPSSKLEAAGSPQAKSDSRQLNEVELTRLLSKRYPEATRSRQSHYRWITNVLARCGVTKVEDLDDLPSSVDSQRVADAMNHALPPGHVRRLDDDLLAAMGEDYLHASVHEDDRGNREPIVKSRLGKLRKAGVTEN